MVNETSAHLHTDLIAGLPGEDMESFSQGFDRLISLKPGEVQVGILKRLRGTPIIRHTDTYNMRYNPVPPYNILSTDRIDFKNMQRLSRFARYWDLVANSGRFKKTLPIILGEQPFNNFMNFSDWLFEITDQTHKFALKRLFRLVYDYMASKIGMADTEILPVLMDDYARSGCKGVAGFMHSVSGKELEDYQKKILTGHKRQMRHLN